MTNKPLLIGITGGIGSGKSTVCEVFKTLGIKVYDSDQRAKMLTISDPILKKEIIEAFGEEAYLENQLNKVFLAKRVFNNADELKKLNSFIHPRVALDFQNWVNANREQKYLLKEAALIFELNGQDKLDKVITVSASEETRIKRVLARDNHRTEADVKKIISNQLSEDVKRNLADYIIENNNDDAVIPQVMELNTTLLSIIK